MKKIVVGVAVALATLIMCMCFAACSNGQVAGNTYKFKEVNVTVDGDISDEMKPVVDAAIAAAKASAESVAKDTTMTFNSDGTVTSKMGEKEETGYYKQVGDKVYPLASADAEVDESSAMYFTVDGSKLIMKQSQEMQGITINIEIIYAK